MTGTDVRIWEPGAATPDEPVAHRFLRLACLRFDGEDGPDRRRAAADLLAAHPDLPRQDVAVAAACADVDAVTAHLAADPAAVRAQAGPYGWAPLLHQAYARHDPDVSEEDTLRTARLLLDAGADPDDGRLWQGLVPPFTVLTGVFGGGEGGQPRHPHDLAFARLVLEAGADPSDGQTLYNRMFGTDDNHLRLLFEFGLGRGGDGPWFRALGDRLDPPAEMLAALLHWALWHDQRDRVDLLAAHGVDVVGPLPASRGRRPLEVALLRLPARRCLRIARLDRSGMARS